MVIVLEMAPAMCHLYCNSGKSPLKGGVGTDSTRHSLLMSSQDEENATGLKPSELLLLGLGGCTAVDVIMIMHKKRQAVTGLEINVRGDRTRTRPGPSATSTWNMWCGVGDCRRRVWPRLSNSRRRSTAP